MFGDHKSKNVNYKVEHPVFADKKERPQISYDQFPEPKNMEQGNFFKDFRILLKRAKTRSLYLCQWVGILANNILASWKKTF